MQSKGTKKNLSEPFEAYTDHPASGPAHSASGARGSRREIFWGVGPEEQDNPSQAPKAGNLTLKQSGDSHSPESLQMVYKA